MNRMVWLLGLAGSIPGLHEYVERDSRKSTCSMKFFGLADGGPPEAGNPVCFVESSPGLELFHGVTPAAGIL
jgi:hypothetical protein